MHVSTRTWQVPRRALSCASTLETNPTTRFFPGSIHYSMCQGAYSNDPTARNGT